VALSLPKLMPSAVQLAAGNPALLAAVQRSRKLLHRRALVAGAASMVPVPGFDWMIDAALLSKIIPEINAEFGLAPAQLDLLEPAKREQVQKVVAWVGSALIGKLVTRDLVLSAAKTVGVRLTAKQATRFVPLAGQAISAAIGYAAIRHLGEAHLKDCVRVAQQVQHLLPSSVDAKQLAAH